MRLHISEQYIGSYNMLPFSSKSHVAFLKSQTERPAAPIRLFILYRCGFNMVSTLLIDNIGAISYPLLWLW